MKHLGLKSLGGEKSWGWKVLGVKGLGGEKSWGWKVLGVKKLGLKSHGGEKSWGWKVLGVKSLGGEKSWGWKVLGVKGLGGETSRGEKSRGEKAGVNRHVADMEYEKRQNWECMATIKSNGSMKEENDGSSSIFWLWNLLGRRRSMRRLVRMF